MVMARRSVDVDHRCDQQLGGSAVRSASLVVLPHNWHFKPEGVPESRDRCPPPLPEGRMCPYIHCTHNLWLVAGVDRPGRYRGHVPNTIADDWQSRPHNCELDYLEAAKGNEIEPRVVAEALGVSERQIRRGQESAKRKLAQSKKAKETFALVDNGYADLADNPSRRRQPFTRGKPWK